MAFSDIDSENSRIFDCHNESWDRNDVLKFYHNKIPSYALWDEISIGRESVDTRIKWWENYKAVSDTPINKIAKQWIQVLNNKKSEIES